MPQPLPSTDDVLLTPPDSTEAQFLARGVVTAVRPSDGLTPLQSVLIEAVFVALTNCPVDIDVEPISPAHFADGLAARNEEFRTRILQVMILSALVLRPLPTEVAERLEAFATELSVGDGMLQVAREYAAGSLGLAAFDFERNGYTSEWSPANQQALHTSKALVGAWDLSINDPALAARWQGLEQLPPDSIGYRLTQFYRARGFGYPGTTDSAPPLLAQHDWVHVLADYGTKVESELEVFAFVARANDDPKAFSLLAMVVSLFETGYLRTGAGLFEAFPGQMSRQGVAVRVADAMRRGALVHGSVDFMATDWFAIADQPVEALRQQFGVVAKSDAAVQAGSVGPWSPGGISPFQLTAGAALADRLGVAYDTFGASVD